MTERDTYIEDLLERFFDGQTSNKEEQELYHFFRREDIPTYLRKYKQVFEYLEKGLASDTEAEFVGNDIVFTPNRLQQPLTKIICLAVAGLAACGLLLFMFNPFSTKPFNPYEGSYIVENGVKSYDMNKIMEQQQVMEQAMEEKEKEIYNVEQIEDKAQSLESEINQKEKDKLTVLGEQLNQL